MQLELLPIPKIRSPVNGRTLAQEALFQAALEVGRQEVAKLEAIGKSLYPDFGRMINAPTLRYLKICTIWHKSRGLDLTDGWEKERMPQVPSKPKPPIQQWSIEAKRRKRLAQLHKQFKAKYSIPELFHQSIQVKVLTNPDYYGVCPLPSEFQCQYYPPNLKQIAAIALENHNRSLGI
jgi:hypothetical protein